MSEQEALAETAGPEVVGDAPETENQEGQVQDQTAEAEPAEDADKAEEKSKAAQRREREKAHKDRLRKEAEDATARAAQAERELARMKQRIESQPPKVEDFPDYEQFQAAMNLWTFQRSDAREREPEIKRDVEANREKAAAMAAQEQQILDMRYAESATEARTVYADFDQVVGQKGLFPVGKLLPELIKESEKPADLAYAVARDKALHDMLLTLPPIELARELGKIEARISRPAPRTQTNAPPPISPVKGTGNATSDPGKMTGPEYMAWRAAGGKL